MILSTTEHIPNKKIITVLGIAKGSTVRARNIGRDIFAGIKNIIGGELSEYTRLQEQSRDEALKRMEDHAQTIGANAVVNIRFATSVITQGCAEVLAYGTAVKLEEL